MPSRIAFEKPGPPTFARYTPLGDGRLVVVRRGKALGFKYGSALSRRQVEVDSRPFWMARFRTLLSPPPHRPGSPPLSADALAAYSPEREVLFLPDAEVLVPRTPAGFSDAEVDQILAAIRIEEATQT